jgi:hypothetical protein
VWPIPELSAFHQFAGFHHVLPRLWQFVGAIVAMSRVGNAVPLAYVPSLFAHYEYSNAIGHPFGATPPRVQSDGDNNIPFDFPKFFVVVDSTLNDKGGYHSSILF